MNEIEKIDKLIDWFRSVSRPEYRIQPYKFQHKLFRLGPGKYLYSIQLGDTDIYKIGISKNPHRRLKQLQAKCPIPLNLIFYSFGHDYEFVEKFLHVQFSNQRIKNEWFRLSTEDIIKITSIWLNIRNYEVPEFSEN